MPEQESNEEPQVLAESSTVLKEKASEEIKYKQSNDEEEKEEEWLDILGSGHLKKKILKHGEKNSRPQPNDICTVTLVGKLENGTIVEEYTKLKFQLGESEVIQGLDLAIALMDLGEEAIVVVGPRFAYGTLGLEPDIPPNATITYNVSLECVDSDPELESISFTQRKVLATSKRERGNWWYARQEHSKAIQCYRRALEILDDSINYIDKDGKVIENLDDEMLKDHLQNRVLIYNNMAAAQLQIQAYDSALSSLEHVLRFDSNNVKALFRKGKILSAKGEIAQAVEVLRQACQLEPDSPALKRELSACIRQQQQDKQHEKKLYKKMFGQDEDKIKAPKPSAPRSRWTKMLGTAATATVMIAIAVAVGYRYKNYSFL